MREQGLPFLCAVLVALVCLPGDAGAQNESVRVTRGGQSIQVERDGDYVRVQTPGQDVQVSGDWRDRESAYGDADVEAILVQMGARQTADTIRVALGSDILFDFDSTAIRADAAATLGQVAQVIRERSRGDVYVLGHTDSVGENAYNQSLSEQRAAAVIAWLGTNEGIPTSIMLGRGMGETRPVAHNTLPNGQDDPRGRARNRRVEVVLATREGVDLRSAVETTDVQVAGTAVRVEEGVGSRRVRVGETAIDVEESTDGRTVRVGGMEVRTGGSEAGAAGVAVERSTVQSNGSSVCESGEECDLTCTAGACDVTCEPGSICDVSCSGGACRMSCAEDAECDFECSGGACVFACAEGSTCETSCSGGACTAR